VFIEEHLQELRRDRFAPKALATYAKHVARRIRENLDANPGAVRSVWGVALGFFALAFLAAAAIAIAYDRHLAYTFFLNTSLWMLIAFVIVTLSLGSLRDRSGYRLSALNVPIVLTLMRVALVPGIALFLIDGHFRLALVTFLIAALSDIADGWIARRWKQITDLGTVLDPVVDIVFNFTLFAGLMFGRLLPAWVFGVAALRYGILVVGTAYLYLFVGPVRIHPTLSGRLTGVLMSVLVAFLTLLQIEGGHWLETLGPLTRIALGVLLSATVVQVIALGWYNLRMMRGTVPAQGRVVGDVRWGPQ
jgi:cardiolipin synthase